MADHEAGVSHKWKVKTKDDGSFEKATLNGKEMNATLVPGSDPKAKIDPNWMQKDMDEHPGDGVQIPQGRDVLGPPYLYCLPLRNSAGQIIWYTCGGNGPYRCG